MIAGGFCEVVVGRMWKIIIRGGALFIFRGFAGMGVGVS